MIDDPIVTEVRNVRARHVAKFNYDLEAIYRDLKEMEKKGGRSYVSYPPRRCQPKASAVVVPDAKQEA